MKVPFLDLRVTDESEIRDLLAATEKVLRHGRIVLGPEVEIFEKRLIERIGRKFVLGVNSGTDALILALRALKIGPGDEVILPPLSFVATANVVTLCGATPVFADLLEDMTLDPASIEPLITARTKAVLPVHWAGKVCRMEEILLIAKRRGLIVIEDAAQSFGARRHGRAAGSFGDVACFSMNCMKVFASVGEAGAIATDDTTLHKRLAQLRYHGLVDKETCGTPSHNGRIDTIHAAMLAVRLDRFDDVLRRRRDNAAYYTSRLFGRVDVPVEEEGCSDVYYTYAIGLDDRDGLKAFLESREIEVKIPHKYLMPQQPIYAAAGGMWPRAAKLHARQLCLPVNEKVTDAQRAFVADSVLDYLRARS